ncbi:MAG: ABC transporter ATP-binding protein [Ruminococcaceae bacterium]|nr:ABC transporter ATP-binding protein [Oscillospiraceae bacterium]
MDINAAPLLEVDGLWVRFGRTRGRFAQGQLEAIRDLSLTVRAGEIVAVVGASGAGKSLLAQAVMGLLPTGATMGGALRYKGQPLTPKRQRQLRGREMALVPQAITWLDPLMRVGPQVRGGDNRPQQAERQRAVFARLGLAPQTERLYPFQLSGGMARRVLLSTAVIGTAQLLIADEPTPGMAPGQAAEALGILRQLAHDGRGVLLITHDLELAVRFAGSIVVFYAGTTVEEALAADFAAGPAALRHPYSQALWRALPQNGFEATAGSQPHAGTPLPGCLYAPRCPLMTAACTQQNPPLRALRGGMVRCIHAT